MINERSEQECAQIRELLVEKMLRKIEELKREKLEKSRADQDRITATAPQGGVGQRPRLTKSRADQDCTTAREHGIGQRPRLTKSNADQDSHQCDGAKEFFANIGRCKAELETGSLANSRSAERGSTRFTRRHCCCL